MIPCLNGANTIAAQLDALAGQHWDKPWEVIVSDNGSTDNTVEIVRQYQDRLPGLRIVDASGRKGQPYALNAGAAAAVGESLAFCDADDQVAPGWLRAMGEALCRHDFIACRIDTTKLNPSWLIRSRGIPQSTSIQNYSYPPYLPHAGGGTLGVKKWLYEKVGGFDDEFPMLHDTDFCWKVQMEGISLHFVPDAVLHMRLRDNMRGIFRQGSGYAEYNVKIYKKYLSFGMPRLSRKRGLISHMFFILSSLRNVHILRDRSEMARWAWQLGWHVGRVKGSIKYRIFAL